MLTEQLWKKAEHLLELLARRFEELLARRSVQSGTLRSLDCAVPSLRAPIGRGRPAMRYGGLAWLPHQCDCGLGCTQTEGNRGRVPGCKEQ